MSRQFKDSCKEMLLSNHYFEKGKSTQGYSLGKSYESFDGSI